MKENKETNTEEFQTVKSLSMILEASKERNSSTSSGIISVIPSVSKVEQQSTIDFGIIFILNYCTFYFHLGLLA